MNQQQKIVECLTGGKQMSIRELSKATGIEARSLASVLSRMFRKKLVKRFYMKEKKLNECYGKAVTYKYPIYFSNDSSL